MEQPYVLFSCGIAKFHHLTCLQVSEAGVTNHILQFFADATEDVGTVAREGARDTKDIGAGEGEGRVDHVGAPVGQNGLRDKGGGCLACIAVRFLV